MVLILTSSFDATTDLLIDRLSGAGVFRFNIDLWKDYRWRICADGIRLDDPSGRGCTWEETGVVYMRKLLFNPPRVDVPAGGSEESWRREELLQVWEGIRDLAHEEGKLALVRPAPTGRWNKIRQMKVASRFFPVPPWEARLGASRRVQWGGTTVAKTMAAAPPGGGGLVTTSQVDPERLSPEFPWLLQEEVQDATHDVTVAWVEGRIFAFETDRRDFPETDCRTATFRGEAKWQRCELSSGEEAGVRRLMEHTGHGFSRLDFMRVAGKLWFLEFNPNGQYAWLDLDGSEGLLDAVAEGLTEVQCKYHAQHTQKNARL